MFVNEMFWLQSRKAFERITVPKIYHPFICGAHNEKLSAMIAETGARINIPPPSVQNDDITIAGEKEGVAAAKRMIENIYKDMVKKRLRQIFIQSSIRFRFFAHFSYLDDE